MQYQIIRYYQKLILYYEKRYIDEIELKQDFKEMKQEIQKLILLYENIKEINEIEHQYINQFN